VVWLRCVGGVDIAAAAARDLYRLAGLPAMVLELFSREHYRDFHGVDPAGGGCDGRELALFDNVPRNCHARSRMGKT